MAVEKQSADQVQSRTQTGWRLNAVQRAVREKIAGGEALDIRRAQNVRTISTPARFKVPDGFDRTQMGAILANRYTYRVEGSFARSWIFYDTFDWRLFDRSLTLQWSGEDLVLRTLSDGRTLHRLPAASPPRFAWTLPEGAFKKQLSSVIEVRRLLELVTAHTRSSTYRVLDREEKTVARLVYVEVRPTASGKDSRLASFLTLLPLRGYAGQVRRLASCFRKHLAVASGNENVYFSAFQAAGQLPDTYSGKLQVRLKPKLPAGDATRIILRHLLETMRANETGIKADIDIEFLHDYRIAVRKTRSALSQIRKVFPEQTTDHYKREFESLGKLTNELRDLDVYLLAEVRYRSILPSAMQDDIAPLFDYLRSRRAEALAAVKAGLEEKTYARLLEEWETFLHEPVTAESAANASTPIIDLARRRIIRRYHRVVRDGTTILEHTEDKLLHALRIECKKLRYLVEFFASLFPPKQIARMIKQLKRLQDNLGEFTDLSVQQDYLLSIAEGLGLDQPQGRRALVATGFLVETMARKQRAVKADFGGIFTEFASPTHQKQFQQLFSKRKTDKS